MVIPICCCSWYFGCCSFVVALVIVCVVTGHHLTGSSISSMLFPCAMHTPSNFCRCFVSVYWLLCSLMCICHFQLIKSETHFCLFGISLWKQWGTFCSANHHGWRKKWIPFHNENYLYSYRRCTLNGKWNILLFATLRHHHQNFVWESFSIYVESMSRVPIINT